MCGLTHLPKALFALLILISWVEAAHGGVMSTQMPLRAVTLDGPVNSPAGEYNAAPESMELQIAQVESLGGGGPVAVLSVSLGLEAGELSCDRLVSSRNCHLLRPPLEILRPS